MEDVVAAMELSGPLHGDDIPWIRHHAQQTFVPLGVGTDGAGAAGGAAGHNLGQMAAALITLGNTAVLGYLPFLLGISLLTGTLTGFVSSLLFRAMAHIKLSTKE